MTQNEVKYTLIASVDDEVVFSSDYPDTTMLQEDGLRKAEYQVGKKLELEKEEDEE